MLRRARLELSNFIMVASRERVEVVYEEPEYPLSQSSLDIGGLMGLYLGVSVVGLCELFEVLLLLLKNLLWKHRTAAANSSSSSAMVRAEARRLQEHQLRLYRWSRLHRVQQALMLSPPMPPPLPTAASLYQRLDGSCHQPSMTRSKTLYSLDDAYLIGHEGGETGISTAIMSVRMIVNARPLFWSPWLNPNLQSGYSETSSGPIRGYVGFCETIKGSGCRTGQLHHSERIDPAAQHPDMPFTPSHRLCTLLLCLAVLSGSSTGFLLLKEASSATTDSLTTRAVEAAAMARPSLKAAELAAVEAKSATAESRRRSFCREFPWPSQPSECGCQADDWQQLGRFEGEAHRARLPASGRLRRGTGPAQWAADDRPKPRSQRENNMSKLTNIIIRYQRSYS
uniref:Uncharacterized protein n=1 Tax=Macrostomum lignano TaxID=282301 RepID=A0A1I8IX62_9PLAT